MQPFDKEAFESLTEKMLRGTITPAEQAQLNEWFDILENKEPSYIITEDVTREELKSRLLNRIKRDAGFPANNRLRRDHLFLLIGQIAACALIILGISIWIYSYKGKRVAPSSITQTDIAPGKNGAVLTLSDGRKIILDSHGSSTSVVVQNGTQAINKDGALRYQNAKQTGNGSVVYNTLSTSEGRQYKLILPDGSAVWLNAASTIKYPVAFTGNSRTVEITGEAYFEVAHNAACPFHVKAGKTDVCVLGTHFNINAYNDEENICTTLLQGSVKVTEGKTIKYLKPGQQSVANPASADIRIVLADTGAVTAWKNGFFEFEGTSLAAMLRQMSRWYGIEVQFEGAVPDMRFGGKLRRSLPLSGVLEFLKEGGIRYSLEGTRLTILSDNQ